MSRSKGALVMCACFASSFMLPKLHHANCFGAYLSGNVLGASEAVSSQAERGGGGLIENFLPRAWG